jgi:hypothetical protein
MLMCVCVCVCAFSLCRESPDMILGDKPLISEVVLSQNDRNHFFYRGPPGGRDTFVFAKRVRRVEHKIDTNRPTEIERQKSFLL